MLNEFAANCLKTFLTIFLYACTLIALKSLIDSAGLKLAIAVVFVATVQTLCSRFIKKHGDSLPFIDLSIFQ